VSSAFIRGRTSVFFLEERMRIGAIGIDSSHLPEFTRRIKALNEEGKTQCKVTHVFDPGGHDLPKAAEWLATTKNLGVTQVGSMDELLGSVDGVMVVTVNGHKHLALSLPSLKRGLPTYIDKPLTCSLAEAKELLQIARQSNARCYSASSLRFAPEVTEMDRSLLGNLRAVDAFGPGQLHALMPGLFFYGVHVIEMVDAIWGPGVRRVSAIHLEDRDLVDLDYHDGRYARLRLERKGSYDFGATVHGEKGIKQFKVDFAPVYTRLAQGMTRFFEGGPAPANLRDLVENVAVMEAGNRSMSENGEWVEIEQVS
jgi:predicted dehydrogenase